MDVTEATSWSPASRETLKWPAYSLAGRVDTSSRRFTLYSVSRKALFRVDPYAVVASPVRPEVLAYAPAGTAFRAVSLSCWGSARGSAALCYMAQPPTTNTPPPLSSLSAGGVATVCTADSQHCPNTQSEAPKAETVT